MRRLRRSDSRPGTSRPPASAPVCGGSGPANPDQDAPAGAGRVDPAVVATRLAHLLTHLTGGRDVLTCGNDLSAEFSAELAARGFTVAGGVDLEHLLTDAAGDLTVIAALSAVLSVPERYFFDDAVAAQFDEDQDLLIGWLDYRNSGLYFCGTGTPDSRADLKAFVRRFRELQQHLSRPPTSGGLSRPV